MRREDAGDIGADSDEGGVAEAHHAAIAEDEIEADGGDRHDDDAREKSDVERLVEKLRGERAGEKDRETD